MQLRDINSPQTVIVTGGSGFIGRRLVMELLDMGHKVINLDALTYAADADFLPTGDYHLEPGDVADRDDVARIFEKYLPSAVFHLAAESHVDRSIIGPTRAVEVNAMGALNVLEACRSIWKPHEGCVIMVSTDETYGPMPHGKEATEDSPTRPSSAYSAGKAAAEGFARAWWTTYEVPTVITRGANTYGPHQHPEKLLPKAIIHLLEGKPVPLYGDGRQVREWLHVSDHVAGMIAAWQYGEPGEAYNLGGSSQLNKHMVEYLNDAMDRQHHRSKTRPEIAYIKDRAGHDTVYAMNWNKAKVALHWRPRVKLDDGLTHLVRWYERHRAWWLLRLK